MFQPTQKIFYPSKIAILRTAVSPIHLASQQIFSECELSPPSFDTCRRYFRNENEIKPQLTMNHHRGTFPILGTSAEVIRAEIIHSAF